MADKNMEAQISVEFEEATSRQSLNSGETINTLWSKVKRWLSDLKAVAFSGSYIDLSDKPTTATTDTDGLMSAEDKAKLDGADNKYASKSKYGDTTINVGRKAGTDVGVHSTAEGYGNTANGNYSHAEGEFTTASGGYSHAEGIHTTASGEMSHAEGNETTASGANSHAEGFETTASGLASHAGGTGTKALHDNEVAYGKYNESKDDTVFSVGDGTADDARHNAFEITKTGGKLHDKDIATTNQIVNNNLLINPDFKINQRGNTDFSVSYHTGSPIPQSQVYTVDRWRIMDGRANISNGKFVLTGTIIQVLENSIGSDFTASVSVESGTATASYNDSTKTFTIVGNSAVLNWAKLEYGSVATPFIPPDPATEWLKCMRYYEKISSGADRSFLALITADYHVEADISFKVPKRTPPSLIADQLRVVISIPGSYIVSFRAFKLYQSEIYGVTFATVDPVITETPSHLFGVSLDGSFAVDAEIY